MNPEIWASKVSYSTDLSPTTIFTLGHRPCSSDTEPELAGRGCTRGGADWVGREGYTGYPPVPSQDPHITIFLASGPYLRPNEGQIKVIYEVSQDGSRIGSKIDLELTRIDPESTLQTTARDGPQMTLRSPYPVTSDIHGPE